MGCDNSKDGKKGKPADSKKGNVNSEHIKLEIPDKQTDTIDPQSLELKSDFLQEHENECLKIVYIDEGKIASISRDYTVKIWNTGSLSPPQTYKIHEHTINSIEYLRFYNYLVTADAANNIIIYSLEKKAEVSTIKDSHKNNGYSAVIVATQNNERIISGGSIEDPRILILDWKNKTIEKELPGDAFRPTLLLTIFSEDLLASAYENEVKVWNMKEGFEVQVLKGHQEEIRGMVACANNQLLTACEDNTIKLWDINSGTEKYSNNRHYKSITAIAQIDNELLVTSAADKEVIFWLIDEQCQLTEIKCFNTGFDEDRDIKNIIRVDGKHFATTNGDTSIQLWK